MGIRKIDTKKRQRELEAVRANLETQLVKLKTITEDLSKPNLDDPVRGRTVFKYAELLSSYIKKGLAGTPREVQEDI